MFKKFNLKKLVTLDSWSDKTFFKLGLIFLLIITIFIILAHQSFLMGFQDISYLVLSAQDYIRNNGLTFWDYWESPPQGRPHNYPPIIPLFMTLLLKAGLTPFLVTIITVIGSVIILLATSWLALGKLFNFKVSFIYLLLATGFLEYLLLIGHTIGASFILLSSPFLLIFIKKNKTFAACLLLILYFYAHRFFPYFIIAGWLGWAFFNRQYFKKVLLIIFYAFLAYLPWLIYLLANLKYLRFAQAGYYPGIASIIYWEINLSLLISLVLALIYLTKNQRVQKSSDHYFFYGIILSSLPLIFFTEAHRFWQSTFAFSAMVIISYFLVSAPGQQKKKIVFFRWFVYFLILMELLFGGYRLYFNTYLGKMTIYHSKSKIIQKILNQDNAVINDYYVLHQKNLALADQINSHSQNNDVILNISDYFMLSEWSDDAKANIAEIFAALSNRGVANNRYPEATWKETLDLNQAKIILADYHQTNLFKNTKNPTEQELANNLEKNFTLIGESDRLTAWANNQANTFKMLPARTTIPLWLCWLMIIGVFGYLGKEIIGLNTKTG